MLEIPAITLWQPWASLLACEAKLYETRGWATSYRGPIAIHAAAKPVLPWFQREVDKEVRLKIIEAVGPPTLLPLGFIVATAELVDCNLIGQDACGVFISKNSNTTGSWVKSKYIKDQNELLFGDWTPGRYAWEFSNMKMLPEPIPAKGRQGLWKWRMPA